MYDGVSFVAVSSGRTRTLVVESSVVGLLALVLVAIQFRLWRATWSEPFTVGGDATFYLMVARTLGDHGTYLTNPDLGWPFGQTLYDLPQGVDNLHLLILRLLAWVSGGPGSAINLFYVLSFGAVAAMTHAVLRILGLRRWLAAVLALLYAYAPYHFVRSEGHLLLSGYQMVPLGMLFALSMFDDTPPLVRLTDQNRVRLDLRSARSRWVLAGGIGLASTGSYYFMFSMGLIVLAASFAAVNHRRWLAPLVSAGALIVASGLVFGLNVSPTLVYQAREGANAGVAQRSPTETELYGLRISQLVMPRVGHRVAPLAKVTDRSQGKVVPSEPGQQLGVIGAIGFVGLLLGVAGAALGRLRGPTGTQLTRLGLLNLCCLLMGTVSGGSLLIAAAGMSYIRAWNRISIVIAFLSLAALGLVVERWLSQKVRPRWAAPAVAISLLAVGLVDQWTPADVPPYDAIAARSTDERPFFRAAADVVGPGGAVFTWPHVPFPEVPDRGGTGAYDQALGYVYEPGVKWSFGFVRGRYPDYPLAFESQPAEEWLTTVVAIGFRALVIDRNSTVGPNAVPDTSPAVQAVLGPPTKLSSGGRYELYDLRGFAAQVKAETLKDRAARALAP